MNKSEQTLDKCLMAIGANCARLLFALQESPEATWGEILKMELACHALEEACSGLQDESAAACEIVGLIEALRGQMTQDRLMDYQELAAFRQAVLAIEKCANRLRSSFAEKRPRSNGRLKTYVFYCSNNLDAGQLAGLGKEMGSAVKTIGLPCSGRVDVPYLMKALETGADGVVVVACPKLECRHFEGSARAHKRVEAVEELLEEIGVGKGRMTVVECAKGGAGQACEEIRRFIEQVRGLPAPGSAKGAVKQESMVA